MESRLRAPTALRTILPHQPHRADEIRRPARQHPTAPRQSPQASLLDPGILAYAERVGFEPTVPVIRYNSLAGSPIRPLSHLSEQILDGSRPCRTGRADAPPASRRGRDSNPRSLAAQRFSRPPPSTARTPLLSSDPEFETTKRGRQPASAPARGPRLLGSHAFWCRLLRIWTVRLLLRPHRHSRTGTCQASKMILTRVQIVNKGGLRRSARSPLPPAVSRR
jgi:hypothetical protein